MVVKLKIGLRIYSCNRN